MCRSIVLLAFAASLSCGPVVASAQMVTMQMPLRNNSASFYGHSHIGWSVNNPHYFMRFNGDGPIPPFGGFQPNAGLHGGFAVGNSQFDFSFGQGASRTSTSATPVLTTTNGYPGSLFVGRTRPFVTGLVPVVGGGFANLFDRVTPPVARRGSHRSGRACASGSSGHVIAQDGPAELTRRCGVGSGCRDRMDRKADQVRDAVQLRRLSQ